MKDLKAEATSIFLETLKSIQLDSVIRKTLLMEGDRLLVEGKPLDLNDYREVVLIGLGKASTSIGAALEAILGSRLNRGVLVTNRKSRIRTRSELIVAGHPLPNENSLKAGERIIQLIESCASDSLVLFAISGGGSSMVELPVSNEITLEDLRKVNSILINCGAPIREINIVRKRLSRVKGGRLGYLARHCQSVALFVSDVNPGDLRSIASNPLLPEVDSIDEFAGILERYELTDKFPASVRNVIRSGGIAELPREWQALPHVRVVLLENADAVIAASRAAEALGYRVEVDPAPTEGDYKAVADAIVDSIIRTRRAHSFERICLVSGGEVSCSVSGRGFGGRNQEFVLYCAARLAANGLSEKIAVLSCGTDGIDGNSSAAGAVADAGVISAGGRAGLDASSFVAENSSTSFLCETGALIVTGPTGNNVRDLTILLIN